MIFIEEKETKKVPGITSLFISFDYKEEIVHVLKNLSCRNYDKKSNLWEVPLSLTNEVIGKLSLYDDIKFKTLPLKSNTDKIFSLSQYKTKPYKYQEQAIQYGLNHDNFLLLDSTGLGKSLELIYLAEELRKKKNINHCLIICGINNLKTNWKKEIERHSNLSCTILGQKINNKGKLVIGSVKQRVEHLNSNIKEFFIITNIETLREPEIIKAILKNKIDMIAVDEIHCCKSSSSQQGKHLLKLNNNKYKVGMTGTPLLNSPLDAYVPLKWIGVEKSSFTLFKYHYCVFTGKFDNILVGYKNTDLLKYQLHKYSLRRNKEDVLDLPPKNIIVEYLDMEEDQSKFYENIKQGIIDEVDKVHISTTSLLSMVTRLRQATACPTILTSHNIISVKVKRACELANELIKNGNKVVIFSTFKETINVLNQLLKNYNPLVVIGDTKDCEVSQIIDQFQNNNQYPLFLATWQKCGTGITLNSASYMIFIDTPWTAAIFNQACDRIYRIGTTSSVFIYNLITKDTIDERVLDILNSKEALSNYIIDDKLDNSTINKLKNYILDL